MIVYLPLTPIDQPYQVDGDDTAWVRDARRMALLYRRARWIVPLLRADGWDVWLFEFGISASRPNVVTRADARRRLRELGVSPRWVELLRGPTAAELRTEAGWAGMGVRDDALVPGDAPEPEDAVCMLCRRPRHV